MVKAFLIAGLLAVSNISQGATSEPPKQDSPALKMAWHTFDQALTELHSRAKECRSQTRPASELYPVIEQLKPALTDASLVAGVGFLAARNLERCEAGAKGALALAWINYRHVAERSGIQPDPRTAGHINTLLTVSGPWFDMAATYQALPEASRDRLERAIGTAPFDGVGLLRLLRSSR